MSASPARSAARKRLLEAQRVSRKWFGPEYDLAALAFTLALAAGEQMNGDTAWGLLLSGPGAAKTEMVMSLSKCSRVYVESSISSPGAFLSGTPKKERATEATGGLLKKIGDTGTMILKDMTTIISQSRDRRAEVMAAFREIFDGYYSRALGTDGGHSISWTGRIVVIGAVTSAWDGAHAVLSAMGDRFVVLRMDSTKGRLSAGRQALRNTGSEVEMRKELSDAASAVINGIDPESACAITLTDAEQERLMLASNIVTLGRTYVEHDYRGDVVDSHEPEMPTRFSKQIGQIARGAIAVGYTRDEAMQLAMRCARDSMLPLRLRCLMDIAAHPNSTPTNVSKRIIDKPRSTIAHVLDDLHAAGLLNDDGSGAEFGGPSTRRYVLAPEVDVSHLEYTADPLALIAPVEPATENVTEPVPINKKRKVK